MNETKRKFLYSTGLALKILSIIAGIFTAIAFASFYFVSSAGADYTGHKRYYSSTGDSKLFLQILPFLIGAGLLFWLGSYLRSNNERLD